MEGEGEEKQREIPIAKYVSCRREEDAAAALLALSADWPFRCIASGGQWPTIVRGSWRQAGR